MIDGIVYCQDGTLIGNSSGNPRMIELQGCTRRYSPSRFAVLRRAGVRRIMDGHGYVVFVEWDDFGRGIPTHFGKGVIA